MAQRNTDITLTPGTWTAISDGAVSTIRMQHRRGAYPIRMAVTLANTAPTAFSGSVEIAAGLIWPGEVNLATEFGGVITSVGYVWAFCEFSATVSVSHA